MEDSGTITIRKDALWKYSTFVLGALVIVLAFVAFSGDTITGNVVNTGTPPLPPVQGQPSTVTASADDDARKGPANAPVEIIEFSDFQCPFCARVNPTLKQIEDTYGDKVTIVFRDFPLTSIHPMAQPAAEAAECVREKGGDAAFWKMHDKIFANQAALSQDNLRAWAKEIGPDITTCLSSGKFKAEVQKDTQDAQAAGGQGTPYFVINGKPLSGAQPFEAFKQVIDAELAA